MQPGGQECIMYATIMGAIGMLHTLHATLPGFCKPNAACKACSAGKASKDVRSTTKQQQCFESAVLALLL